MKPIWKSFGIFLRQIREDAMLFAVLIAPVWQAARFASASLRWKTCSAASWAYRRC
jgi:hypothetical protein